MSGLEVLTGKILWWNMQLCEGGGNFHKAIQRGKNNSFSPTNSAYLVTGKANSSLQWQTAWDGRWGHAPHCLYSRSLPPTCTAFCSFCAITEHGFVFLQQQERSSGSRKLKLPGFFPAFWSALPPPPPPKCLVLIFAVKMSVLCKLSGSLGTKEESAPNDPKCGISFKKQSASECHVVGWGLYRFLSKKGSISTARGSDMKHKKTLDISKCLLNVSVGSQPSTGPNLWQNSEQNGEGGRGVGRKNNAICKCFNYVKYLTWNL